MTERFVNVKTFTKRKTGRKCMHCGRPARVLADRIDRYRDGKRFRLQVRYCDEHAQLRGAV